MKIGLVTPYIYPLPGGVNAHVRYLYENLIARGHDVRIISSTHGPQRQSEGDVIRLGVGISVPANGSVGTLTFSPRFGPLVREMLERERFDEVNLFLSATETHNRKNVNRSIEESLSGLERVLGRAREEGLRCEGVISVSFGCPYEGDVPEERVLSIARRLVESGCQEIAFGDTTGMANPRQVRGFFERADAVEIQSVKSIESHVVALESFVAIMANFRSPLIADPMIFIALIIST